MTAFSDLDLIEPLQRAVARVGYTSPTPIQEQAIPPLLEGRDVLGCAQTGTGKTAAFALPVLQHMAQRPAPRGRPRIRALILTPTRELAAQIDDNFKQYSSDLRTTTLVMFGGVNEKPQIAALRRGIDVLVATPGRLLDLEGRGHVDLRHVEFFVLDEADRMLDMGFIHDVRRVLERLPRERQNLLFSATMPPKIVQLAGSFLRDPVKIEVTPESTTVEQIDQCVYFTERPDKRRLLVDLIHERGIQRAIVFTRTKHGANRLTKQLDKAGINAAPIHGNKSQAARERALDGFRKGTVKILVATDIAARGIDVDDVTHVFNFDLPNEPESYVHRIGRTGRAGKSGVAIAFCDPTEGEYLRDIEKLIGFTVPVIEDHAYHCPAAVPPPAQGSGRRSRERSGGAAGGREAARRGRRRGGRRGGGGRPQGGGGGGGRGGRSQGGGGSSEGGGGGGRGGRRRRRRNGGRVRPESSSSERQDRSTPSFGRRRGGPPRGGR